MELKPPTTTSLETPIWVIRSILEFSRETELIGYVYIEKQIYYKELAHTIMKAGESEK